MGFIQEAATLRAANTAMFLTLPVIVSTLTFLSHLALGYELTPDLVFASMTMIHMCM